jgi:integration host factor subunit beta
MKSGDHRTQTYTKKDIAKQVAERNEEKFHDAVRWVDRTFTALRETMTKADPELRIEIRDFGVFEVKLTKPKPKARNPKSGELIFVPARRKTHFKPNKLLKRFLSQPLNDNSTKSSKKQD